MLDTSTNAAPSRTKTSRSISELLVVHFFAFWKEKAGTVAGLYNTFKINKPDRDMDSSDLKRPLVDGP